MKSMTGFGRGIAISDNGTQAVVEITAVNGKKLLEMRVSLPRELSSLESEMRNQIQKQLSRGTLNVSVSYTLSKAALQSEMPLDRDFADAVALQLKDMARQYGMPEPSLSDLLIVPGVIKVSDTTADIVRPLVFDALQKAIVELDAVRNREGEALKSDLHARGEVLSGLLASIVAKEKETAGLLRDRLVERISKLGIELPVDDERLAKEIAFYVDKADITEEMVRLKSHMTQYETLINSNGDIGRNLDFLSQEISREINTLSSKTPDTAISEFALAFKIELSKIREQVMNVE